MGADVTKKLEIIISSKANLTDAAKISKAFGQVKDRLTELSQKLGITGKRMGGFMRQAQIGREKTKALTGQMKTQATQVDKLEKKIRKLEIRLKKQSTTTSKVDKTTRRYRKTVDQLGTSYKRTEKEARHYDNTQGKIRGHTEGLRRVVGALRNQILLFLFALRGVIDVITSSVEASNQLESALVGLRAVTEKTGTSFFEANKFILEFTQTGLISVASTAAGLKNLLSAGFGMPEAIQLMKTLGDAAAFNRQGTLEYGAAIEGATQGIKNQNCLSYHTQIYDPVRGQTKTIEEWHDEGTVPCVLSVNRQTGEMEVIQAEYLHYNGENEVFEIELEDGTTIEATANHRFLTQDGFKFLEDLDLDNDVLYYVDEEEVENIVSSYRNSIMTDRARSHNEFSIDNVTENYPVMHLEDLGVDQVSVKNVGLVQLMKSTIDQVKYLADGLQLNVETAEKILYLLENESKKVTDYFVLRFAEVKIMDENTLAKTVHVIVEELKKFVNNAENQCQLLQALLNGEDPNTVLWSVQQMHFQDLEEEKIIHHGKVGKVKEREDQEENIGIGKKKYLNAMGYDAANVVELATVIITRIIFSHKPDIPSGNIHSQMVSPFVQSVTEKYTQKLTNLLKSISACIPTPMKIAKISSKGITRTYDLSVAPNFNFVGNYIIGSNSIMTDNAGITKNLNIMYKEFAATIDKGAMSLSKAEKNQAIYLGFLKEGAIFQGNMNLLTATYMGKTQKLSQIIFKAKAAFGSLIKEGLVPFVAEVEKAIAATAEWIKENEVLIKTEVKVFLEALVAGLKTTWDMLIGVNDALKIFGINIKDVIVFFTLFKGASLIIGKLTGLVSGLAGVIKFALGVQVVSAVAKVTRLQGVLWKLGLVFRSLGGAAGIAAKGVMLFKGAIAILGGPIGAIIVAVTALASAFGFLWLKNKQATKEAEEATRQYKTELRELIQIRHDESLSIVTNLEKKLADKKITRDQRIEVEKLLVVEREHEQFLRTRKVVEDARKAFEEEKMISKMRFESVERFGNLSRDIQKEKMEALEAEIQEEKGLFNLSQRFLDSKRKGFEDAKIDRELTKEEITRGDELLKQAQDKQDLGAKGIGTLELTLKYMRDIYGYEKKITDEIKKKDREKSLKSLLALIERLKGELSRMGLVGVGRQLEDFKTKIALLEVQYAEFARTIKKGNVHLKTLRGLIDELGEKGPLDILNKTFRELRKEIESIGIDPLSDKINKHNERMERMRLGWSQFKERLTSTQMEIVGVKERLQEVANEIDTLDRKIKERLVTDEIRKWAEESAQSINQLSASIRGMAFAGIQEPIFGGLFGAGQRGEVDRLKIQIEGYEKLTEAQQRYALAEARLQDMKDRGAITERQKLNELADARKRLEVETTLIQQEETFKRIELARSEWQQRLDMIESLIGGWQQLGETWGELQWGQANEMEAQMDRQRDLLDRGKIDIQQYNDRVKQIEQAAQKDREKIRAQFLANLIRQAGQVAQQYFIQAAAGQLAGASSMAAAAIQWAAFFTAQAGIHAGLAANPLLAPVHGPIALSYGIAAGASATLGTAASVAGGVGLAALGAGIGIVSGLAASAIESNNLGAAGGFLGTPTEDVFEDRNKRLGGSIRAQEVHLSINPVTYIQAEGDIFIGEGITVETFKGLVNEAFIKGAQDALEEGTLQIDSLVNVKG